MDIRLDFFLLKTEAFLDLLIDPSLRPSKYGPSMIYRQAGLLSSWCHILLGKYSTALHCTALLWSMNFYSMETLP